MPPSTPAARAELSALLRLAIPLGVAQGGQALMGVVDAAVVGRAGAVALAGTGLGNAVFMALSIFGMGAMTGLDPLVAQAFGAGDGGRARRLLWQGTWLALLVSAALAVPLAAAPAAFVPLGVAPDVAAAAGSYLRARLPGLPFVLVYFAGRAYLQGAGAVRPIVVATAVANAANLPLDVLLVFGGAGLGPWAGPLRRVPAMGAAGAALATTACAVLQASVLALAARSVAAPAGAAPARRPAAADLRAAARVGVPSPSTSAPRSRSSRSSASSRRGSARTRWRRTSSRSRSRASPSPSPPASAPPAPCASAGRSAPAIAPVRGGRGSSRSARPPRSCRRRRSRSSSRRGRSRGR